MNAEIYEPLWANTAPSILKSNYKTSNLSHKQQKLSSLGFLTILTPHHSLQPDSSSLPYSVTAQARQKDWGAPQSMHRQSHQPTPPWATQGHQAKGTTFQLPQDFSAAKPHLAVSACFSSASSLHGEPREAKAGEQPEPTSESLCDGARKATCGYSQQTAFAQWGKKVGFFKGWVIWVMFSLFTLQKTYKKLFMYHVKLTKKFVTSWRSKATADM